MNWFLSLFASKPPRNLAAELLQENLIEARAENEKLYQQLKESQNRCNALHQIIVAMRGELILLAKGNFVNSWEGKSYTYLGVFDAVQFGDEYYSNSDSNWSPVRPNMVGHMAGVGLYRRKEV